MTTNNLSSDSHPGFARYRHLVRYLLIFLFGIIPFITVDRQSFLRFDIPTLNLRFFGKTIWIENFFIILLFILFISFLFLFITQVFGRIWCGWICFQTLFSDLTRFLFQGRNKSLWKKIFQHLVLLALGFVIALTLVFYFINPYEFFAQLVQGKISEIVGGFIISLSIISYLNFAFWRYDFCKKVCPYGKMQTLIFNPRTLLIELDPLRKEECIECLKCVRTCPVNIDIRQGLDAACTACTRCIDACAKAMAKKGKQTLIDYRFLVQDPPFWKYPPVLMTAGLSIIFFIFFSASLFFMEPYVFEIYPNFNYQVRMDNDKIINGFKIKVINKSDRKVELSLNIKDLAEYEIKPEQNISLKPMEFYSANLYIVVPERILARDQTHNFEIEAGFASEKKRYIQRKIMIRKEWKK
jgi:polyferredoxin